MTPTERVIVAIALLFIPLALLVWGVGAFLFHRYRRAAMPSLNSGGIVVWRCSKCKGIVDQIGDAFWWCPVCERVCDKERL